MTQLCLPYEIWLHISIDNSMTYSVLVQVSKIFSLDTDVMKAKFIKQIKLRNGCIHSILPNGDLHSIDDKPAVMEVSGDRYWYANGKLHRDNDKPAGICVAAGGKFWYIDGKLHRDDGLPAIIWATGNKSYYVNGVEYH